MISDPDFFLEEFAEAGSDSLLVHWEGNNNLHRTVQRVKALGKRVGVVINPATPAAVLEEILQDVDQVLVMTVNPGFGHQHFLHTTLPKIRRVREMIERSNPAAIWRWTGASMRQPLHWSLPPEPTCWWPDRRSSVTTTGWRPP